MNSFHQFLKTYCVIVLLFSIKVVSSDQRTCFSCDGINCQRTTLNKTETCNDPLDLCVTIFKDFTVLSKGCLLRMPDDFRSKCDDSTLECDKCQGELCNKYGRKDFLCVECETEKDKNCDANPEKIAPTRCPAPSSLNSYCYVERKDGKVTKRGCSTETKHQRYCYSSQDSNCSLCIPSDNVVCNAPRASVNQECPAFAKSSASPKFFLGSIATILLGIRHLF